MQMNLFRRNIRWIERNRREQLQDELRIGLDSAHTYLYLFQNTSAVIKSRAAELKKCLNEHIDLSEPEISVIT
jgi:hypothetical protein